MESWTNRWLRVYWKLCRQVAERCSTRLGGPRLLGRRRPHEHTGERPTRGRGGGGGGTGAAPIAPDRPGVQRAVGGRAPPGSAAARRDRHLAIRRVARSTASRRPGIGAPGRRRAPASDADERSDAFAFIESARTLVIGHLLHDDDGLPETLRRDRYWAAAEWAVTVDRLLAAIDASPPVDTAPFLESFDVAEHRLRDVEVAIDAAHRARCCAGPVRSRR